jgi:hypothetical protein
MISHFNVTYKIRYAEVVQNGHIGRNESMPTETPRCGYSHYDYRNVMHYCNYIQSDGSLS